MDIYESDPDTQVEKIANLESEPGKLGVAISIESLMKVRWNNEAVYPENLVFS